MAVTDLSGHPQTGHVDELGSTRHDGGSLELVQQPQ